MGPSFKLIGESTPQNWCLEDDACGMMPIISGVNVIDLLLWSNHCVHLSCSGKNQNGLKKTTGHTQPIPNTKPYQTIQHPLFLSGLVNPPFFSHSVNYSYIWVAIHNDVEAIPGRASGWLKFHFLRVVLQPTVIFHGQTPNDIFFQTFLATRLPTSV